MPCGWPAFWVSRLLIFRHGTCLPPHREPPSTPSPCSSSHGPFRPRGELLTAPQLVAVVAAVVHVVTHPELGLAPAVLAPELLVGTGCKGRARNQGRDLQRRLWSHQRPVCHRVYRSIAGKPGQLSQRGCRRVGTSAPENSTTAWGHAGVREYVTHLGYSAVFPLLWRTKLLRVL